MKCRRSRPHPCMFFGAGLLLAPQFAQANAGLPMIVLIMPALALSIVPIVLIEAFYLARRLELSARQVIITVTVSNLVSSLVGIPLAWGLLAGVQLITGGGSAYGLDSVLGRVLAVTWQAPWLIPYESAMGWMIPLAGLFLLVPFFFVSWWSEYWVTRKILSNNEAAELYILVRNANLISYALLGLWPLALLIS